MRLPFLCCLGAFLCPSDFAIAAGQPQLGLSFNTFRVGRSALQLKSPSAPSSRETVFYADTLGLSGSEQGLPWMELALRFRRFVGYAYPFPQDGRREVWLGATLEDYTEAGFVVAQRRQSFSEARDFGNDSPTKKIEATAFGLFYRQKFLLLSQTIEAKLRGSLNISETAFVDPSQDTRGQGFALSAETSWIWELSQHFEVASGIAVDYEKVNRRRGSVSAGAQTGFEISAHLLRAVVTL
ncbi:MAG: hypothetical protein RLZZ488_2517 [Pseudomonadota bacterium]|jgi:hypothetical protein